MRFARSCIGFVTLALLLSGGPVLRASPDKTVEEALGDALTHTKVRAALVDRLAANM